MKVALLLVLAAGVLLHSPALADVTIFAGDLPGFNTAANNAPIVVDFDSLAPGTDISGQTLTGVTFIRSAAPLIVVVGTNTTTPGGFGGIINAQTNKLYPTSGLNVLSPGGATLGPGPNPTVEEDSLELRFAWPVSAVGFDHLSQSADGSSYTTVTVYDWTDALLYSDVLPISDIGNAGGGAPGGADFWCIVSTNADISRVVITEGDADEMYPDCNIGLDTIRVGGAAGVPAITIRREPGEVRVLFTGLLERATALAGSWQTVSNVVSPHVIPDGAATVLQFFRARSP